MAYSIFKDFNISAAHHIPGHPGKCRHLHGHNYKVRLYAAAEKLDELGMVVDFARLKAILEEVAGPYDHRVLNDIPPFDKVSSTAERIAEHVCRTASEKLGDGDGRALRVVRVEVWESDTCGAIYEP